jgi:serine/threonine-protein kinase
MVDFGHIEEKIKFVGTPNFVPPEILLHEEYDESVDIFSLGVILHFILTGTLPFHGINFT